MRIAFINKYQNLVNRGAETFVRELSKRLSKNHEIKIFTEIKPLELMKFDIVIPTNGRIQVFVVRAITKIAGKKMIVSGQSGIGLDDRLNLYAFPDYFITLSKTALEWAKKVNPLIKTKRIANGVDLTKFSENKKTSESIVLAVGAFTKEKQHDLTIRAIAKLVGVKLVIVGGGGELKNKIEKLCKTYLEGRFEILTVSNEKMPNIYKKAKIFVYPTVSWESFGIAIVEAMASGLPVVSNDDPIRREIVGDAGFFINPTDVDAYATAIDKALKINWGNKPRKQAEKFDWDKIAEKYEELFKSL